MGSRERVSRVDDENSHYLSVRYLLLASIEQPLSLEVCETGMLPIWVGMEKIKVRKICIHSKEYFQST